MHKNMDWSRPRQRAELSFFFQAEDGIRDDLVTGVQTCALPIYTASNTWVSNDYFGAMGIQLLAGRGFNDDDREGVTPVAVINQTFARKFWPGEDPVGKRIRWGGWGIERLTVIGIVADVRAASLEREPAAASYMPIFQVPRTRRNV